VALRDPIDTALLMDYWRAALEPAQEEAVETHLFSCDACGDRLRLMIALADSLCDGRMQDVPMNETAGAVVYQESIDFAKTAPSPSTTPARFQARQPGTSRSRSREDRFERKLQAGEQGRDPSRGR